MAELAELRRPPSGDRRPGVPCGSRGRVEVASGGRGSVGRKKRNVDLVREYSRRAKGSDQGKIHVF